MVIKYAGGTEGLYCEYIKPDEESVKAVEQSQSKTVGEINPSVHTSIVDELCKHPTTELEKKYMSIWVLSYESFIFTLDLLVQCYTIIP